MEDKKKVHLVTVLVLEDECLVAAFLYFKSYSISFF